MSPIGGVGINLAIQDAVAAANMLAGPMAAGEDVDPLLPGPGAAPARRRGSSRPGQKARAGTDHRPRCFGERADHQRAAAVRLLDRYPAAAADSRAALIGLGFGRSMFGRPSGASSAAWLGPADRSPSSFAPLPVPPRPA